MKILLVEDERPLRRLWVHLIERLGHSVHAFGDAEEAWAAFQQDDYPFLILDWMLPGMSGLELCQRVRALPKGRDSVILVITALNEAEHLTAVLDSGADDYMAKPVDREELEVRLRIMERRAQDLRRRYEAEARLRLLAAAIGSADEGVLVIEAVPPAEHPSIVFANERMGQMAGRAVDELVGGTAELLMGPETNPSLGEMLTGEPGASHGASIETVNYGADGRPFRALWNVAPVRDEAGQVTHRVALLQDVTAQRLLEHEIVAVSEREQQRIGRDLHDSLGQQLTGLAFLTATLQHTVQPLSPVAAKQAASVAELVEDCKRSVQQISRGLLRFSLSGGGLRRALEELAAETEKLSGIPCRLRWDDEVKSLDGAPATHLYRIAQEAVNNAVKYSEASRIEIRVRRADEALELVVEDDGDGLPDQETRRVGMGHQIMSYRARMVNAHLEVGEGSEGGTSIRCVLHGHRALAASSNEE